MMNGQYILIDHKAVEVEDLLTWAKAMEQVNRHVGHTQLGTVRVSTVFLGLDHSFGSGPPLLFETMIFGGPHDGYQERYATWDEAEAGHQRAVELAKTADAVGQRS